DDLVADAIAARARRGRPRALDRAPLRRPRVLLEPDLARLVADVRHRQRDDLDHALTVVVDDHALAPAAQRRVDPQLHAQRLAGALLALVVVAARASRLGHVDPPIVPVALDVDARRPG